GSRLITPDTKQAGRNRASSGNGRTRNSIVISLKRQPARRATFAPTRMVDDRTLDAVSVDAVDPHARTAGCIRLCRQVAVLGVPLRTGSPHVVEIGPIGPFAAEASAPQPAQALGKIVPHWNAPNARDAEGRSQGRPHRPPSNRCINFKRMFETKFGQESLRIGRLSRSAAVNYWTKFPSSCQAAAA